jgi:hypothetical protein
MKAVFSFETSSSLRNAWLYNPETVIFIEKLHVILQLWTYQGKPKAEMPARNLNTHTAQYDLHFHLLARNILTQ